MKNSISAGIEKIPMVLLGFMLKIIFGRNSPVMRTNNVDNNVWINNIIKSLVMVSGNIFMINGSNILAIAIP